MKNPFIEIFSRINKNRKMFFDILIGLSVVFSVVALLCAKRLTIQFAVVFFECAFLFFVLVIKYNLQDELKNSYFVQAFVKNQGLCITALVAAAICLLISYPGNLYSDSYGRIQLASKFKQIVYDVIKGVPNNTDSWLNVIPTCFIAFFYFLTGNVAAYAFAQAFFFFYISLINIKRLCNKCRLLAYAFFIFNPIFFCVSTYYEIASGCAIGIVGLLLVLTVDESKLNPMDKVFQAILIVFTSFVTFGYRYNAFTMLPVFCFMAFYYQRKKLGRILAICGLLLGLFFVSFVPKILHITQMSRSCDGFLWKVGTTLARMPPELKEKYSTYLDDLFGEGATKTLQSALYNEGFNKDNFNPNIFYMFKLPGFSEWKIDQEVGLKKIFKKYLLLFIKEPMASIKTELLFDSYVLGIGNQIYLWEWDYDRWGRGKNFGLSDSKMRHRFMELYPLVVNNTYIPLHPWLMLLITCIFVFLKLKFFRIKILDSLEFWLILLAVFYYGAFLINTQSMEFRYYYPAFYCMMLACISSCTSFLGTVILNVKEWLRNV